MRFLLFLMSFLIFSCGADEFEPNNPIDPDNPDYIPPVVSIVSGVIIDQVINSETLAINYSGNESSMLFRTKLDSNAWSGWLSSTTVTLNYLDEGEHEFFLQGKYTTGDTSEVLWVPFTVDAVQGPALIFFPRLHTTNAGQTIKFKIVAEEVYSLAGAEFQIVYDPAQVIIQNINVGSIFSGSSNPIFIYENKPSEGKLVITTATWGQDQNSFTGTATIAEIDLEVLTIGEFDISFSGSEIFRNNQNEVILINEINNGNIKSN